MLSLGLRVMKLIENTEVFKHNPVLHTRITRALEQSDWTLAEHYIEIAEEKTEKLSPKP